MNEVMTLAEDNKMFIYYQDTDSMHIKDKDIEKLAKNFEQTYNRKSIGKATGQFHSDFSLNNCKDVKAIKSIFLGKKCYIDELEGIFPDMCTYVVGYYIRMKGIPTKSVEC